MLGKGTSKENLGTKYRQSKYKKNGYRVETPKRTKQDTGKTRIRTIIDKDKNKTKPRKGTVKTEINQDYFCH